MAQPIFFEQTAPPADSDLDGFGRFYVLLRAPLCRDAGRYREEAVK
jgi:hypothetical protein